MTNQSLLDLIGLQEQRQQGIDTAHSNSPDHWRTEALKAIEFLKADGGTFTSEDVRAQLSHLVLDETKTNPWAWTGGVFQGCKRRGDIFEVGVTQTPTSKAHSRWVPVYSGQPKAEAV